MTTLSSMSFAPSAPDTATDIDADADARRVKLTRAASASIR